MPHFNLTPICWAFYRGCAVTVLNSHFTTNYTSLWHPLISLEPKENYCAPSCQHGCTQLHDESDNKSREGKKGNPPQAFTFNSVHSPHMYIEERMAQWCSESPFQHWSTFLSLYKRPWQICYMPASQYWGDKNMSCVQVYAWGLTILRNPREFRPIVKFMYSGIWELFMFSKKSRKSLAILH